MIVQLVLFNPIFFFCEMNVDLTYLVFTMLELCFFTLSGILPLLLLGGRVILETEMTWRSYFLRKSMKIFLFSNYLLLLLFPLNAFLWCVVIFIVLLYILK